MQYRFRSCRSLRTVCITWCLHDAVNANSHATSYVHIQVHWMGFSSMRIECAFIQSTLGGGLEVDSKWLMIEMRGQGRKSCDTVPSCTTFNTARSHWRVTKDSELLGRCMSRGRTHVEIRGLKGLHFQAVHQRVVITWQKIATLLLQIKSILPNCSFERAQCALYSHCHECEFNPNSMRIEARYHVNGP